MGNTFSPISEALDWETIKNQGLKVIGKDKMLCKGLYAAAQFYVPEFHKRDSHTFISLQGLGSKNCPLPKIGLDENIQNWLKNPAANREKVIKYSQDIHGKNLNGIVYLYVPAIEAYTPDKINEFVKQGRELLTQAQVNKAKGLIVDLRFNTGGDLKSMLLILGGILPKGRLMGLAANSFVSLSADGNHLLLDNQSYAAYNGKKPLKLSNIPVAILINGITASSAEMTALSLKNNISNSKLFGTHSSAALSTNQTFFLWDGNTFSLMFERIYDKNGKPVPFILSVDYEIEDNLKTVFDPKNDRVIQKAVRWINSR